MEMEMLLVVNDNHITSSLLCQPIKWYVVYILKASILKMSFLLNEFPQKILLPHIKDYETNITEIIKNCSK